MSTDTPIVPIIIKRKKVIVSGGHHGGAWKVAYADFVTAMMAFFMLMWLLNATTEQQRRGLADYFSPTLAINRSSGGGTSSFVGDTVFTEETLTRQGVGASNHYPTESIGSRGTSGLDNQGAQENQTHDTFQEVIDQLQSKSGESTQDDELMKHIVTEVSDKGLVIELFEFDKTPLFTEDNTPNAILIELLEIVKQSAQSVTNDIAIETHVASKPVVLARQPQWDDTMLQATAVRQGLEQAGFDPNRIIRTTGHADRLPRVANPMAGRNNRIEIVFLR